MQSGKARTNSWVLEYDRNTARTPEPLMGWVSSGDTMNQVLMNFETQKKAVSFAKQKGWDYRILPSHEKTVKPRNFGDNFKYIPPEE